MTPSHITLHLIGKQPIVFENMELSKEAHGITVYQQNVLLPNLNKKGNIELFFPYTSILKVIIKTVTED